MIRTIVEKNPVENERLLNAMYRARKTLFVDRLGWTMPVDDDGREIDRFDALSPVYLVDTDDRGRHRGSVRMLPTTGDTVLGDRIAALFDGLPVASPSVWEFTRFCVSGENRRTLAPRDVRQTTLDLLLAICETCMAKGVDHVVGSFDQRMRTVCDLAGWSPELLGRGIGDHGVVYLGIWETTAANAAILRAAGGVFRPCDTAMRHSP